MSAAAGDFDRRIIVQVATETRDGAGDVIQGWGDSFKLWSMRVDARGREFFGAQQIVRDADTVFEVRANSLSRAIAPETHRIIDRNKIFEIVGNVEGRERGDTLLILCASTPALRGARAPVNAEE